MNKFLLTIFLSAIGLTAFAQFNRDLRTKEPIDDQHIKGILKKIIPAEFPGGMIAFYKYLSKKMKLPKEAKKQNLQGKVRVQFVIDSTGNVKEGSVKVIRSSIEAFNKEAIRLIKNSPTWIPAVDIETNRKIETTYELPILF